MDEKTPRLQFEWATGYDFFMSTVVLHEPERFRLRAKWAAGVRSRVPAAVRPALKQIGKGVPIPLTWVHQLPAPRDAATVLRALEEMTARQRCDSFVLAPGLPEALAAVYRRVADRGAWDKGDREAVKTCMVEMKSGRPGKKELASRLNLWAEAERFGEMIIAALTAYYEVFFAEEEQRIAPALAAGDAHARSLAQSLPVETLLETLTGGVRLAEVAAIPELVLAPSFWADPLLVEAMLGNGRYLFLYGARPANASLVPGQVVPDALFQALKALADPTRLRILRYLAEGPQTPGTLARQLRLRPPTVTHHLDTLRLARLVQLTIDSDHRRMYAARPEALAQSWSALQTLLDADTVPGE